MEVKVSKAQLEQSKFGPKVYFKKLFTLVSPLQTSVSVFG
jgi:hypothetical protein